MSGLGDAPFQRVTVEYLKKNLSARLDEPFTGLVTLTSLATSLDSVTPGSLFVPGPDERNYNDLHRAVDSGAYAVLLPESDESVFTPRELGIPVLFARDIERRLGNVAAYMEGDPSDSLAIFVAYGQRAQKVAAKLAALLHMLGNPVGLVSQEKSYSLNRGMNLKFPLNAGSLQGIQSVSLEDGAAALVIAADARTLEPFALAGTHADVCSEYENSETFGAVIGQQTHHVKGGMFDSDLARLGSLVPIGDPVWSTAISMALAAGITIESIQQAVKVTEEFS